MTDTIPLFARLLVTFGTLAYALGPFVIDMNKTHLLHPAWTGHARFHLMWAAVSQLAVGGIAFWLIWSDRTGSLWSFRLAAAIGLCMTSGFWIAFGLKKLFSGTLHDIQGIPPIAGKVDGNLIAVLMIDVLLIVGLYWSY